MKKNRLLVVVGVVGLILTLVALPLTGCAKPAPAPAPAPAPEVFKWRMQTWAMTGAVTFEAQQAALDLLREITDGRLDITLLPAKAIVGYSEMLEALGAGTYEVGCNASTFFSGLDPGFAAIWNLPGIWGEPREAGIWFDQFGGNELFREAYAKYNVHYVAPVITHAEPMMSKKALRTLGDFKGLKLRTTPGLTHNLFERLGAVPIAMAGPDIYSGLDTGLIDAAEYISLTDNWGVGLHEVTKYVLWPGIHCPTANCDISVNTDAWNKLPDDLKAAFEWMVMASREYNDYWAEGRDYDALEKMKAYGLEHTRLSEADMVKTREMGIEIAEAWKAKSAMSDAVISSVFDYLRLIGKM